MTYSVGGVQKDSLVLSPAHRETRRLAKLFKHLETCDLLAKRYSTCAKRQYYAIIVRPDGSFAAQGYNGAAKGQPHCEELPCPRLVEDSAAGSNYDNCIAIHAEQNALLHSADCVRGCAMIINGPPCMTCAKLIVQAGIKELVCWEDLTYKQWPSIRDYLKASGIELYAFKVPDEV